MPALEETLSGLAQVKGWTEWSCLINFIFISKLKEIYLRILFEILFSWIRFQDEFCPSMRYLLHTKTSTALLEDTCGFFLRYFDPETNRRTNHVKDETGNNRKWSPRSNTAVPPAQQDKVAGLKRLELRIPAWTIENDKTVIRVRLAEN